MRYLVVILALVCSLPSCKKGEDDPLFSLRSRQNRISGEWTVSYYQETANFGELRNTTFVEDSNIVYEYADSTSIVRNLTWTFSINREGEYTSVINEVFPFDSVTSTIGYTEVRTVIGDWEFTGGNGEKQKSQLLLLPRETMSERSNQGSNIEIESISGPVVGFVYSIDRLTNKELWLSFKEVQTLPFDVQERSFTMRLAKQ